MPNVVASAAVIIALGLVWGFASRMPGRRVEPSDSRAPTEIADAVPLVRDADGVYRPADGEP